MLKKQFDSLTLLLLFVLVFALTRCSKPDNDPPSPPPPPPPAVKPGVIKGRILNEFNQLLNSATVTIQRTGNNTIVTNTTGSYRFDSVQPGSYNLSVKRNGYIETTVSVSVVAGDTTTNDVVLKAGTAYLDILSDSIIVVKPHASKFTIQLASNTAWSVANTNNWLTPNKLNSNGEDSVVVNYSASPLDIERQGTLVIQAGSIVKNIVVKQLPEVKLKQIIPLPGNHTTGASDSIALEFNQPVTVKSLIPGYTLCQSNLGFSYSGNKVTFSYGCAAMGGDYPFTITTNNSLGDQYSFTFSVGFYQKIINITGGIRQYFANDADNSYWIITDHPNKMYKIDMTTFQILHTYDLPGEVAAFTINLYNNKIYLAYHRVPKLYILNHDGSTNQVIDIQRDPVRNVTEYYGPYIYPIKIAFAQNGKGMIWLRDQSSTEMGLYWFIDAASDHRMWYEEIPGSSAGGYYNPKVNYNKTTIVLNSGNGDPTINMFNLEDWSFFKFRPSKYDVGNFVTPSRKSPNLFIGQAYFQLITNPFTGFESVTINKDNRFGGNVDFTYKPGKDLSVYFTEGTIMQVVDYATGKTPVKHDALYNFQGTTATLDGQFVIVNRHDGNYNSKVVQLPASWFDY